MSIRYSLLLLMCLVCLLVGCGYNGRGSSTAAGSSVTVTSVPRITPGSSVVATVSPRVPVPGSGGHVSVQISALTYHPGDTIVVTISNQSAQAIFFADHQSNCTVVLLQHQSGPSWEAMALCKLMIATRIQTLDAGAKLTVLLKANPTMLWPGGTYRIAFGYSARGSGGLGSSQIAYSPLFQVS